MFVIQRMAYNMEHHLVRSFYATLRITFWLVTHIFLELRSLLQVFLLLPTLSLPEYLAWLSSTIDLLSIK